VPEAEPRGAFVDEDGAPRLLRCVVLFLDILGVSDMALDQARRDRNLVELDRALRRSTRDFLSEDSPWPSALLSDSLVVADATRPGFDDVMALNEMLFQTAILQLQLASHGFFARGRSASARITCTTGWSSARLWSRPTASRTERLSTPE
jgi:hypothetical protein